MKRIISSATVGLVIAVCCSSALAATHSTYRAYGSCNPAAVGVCTPKVISESQFRRALRSLQYPGTSPCNGTANQPNRWPKSTGGYYIAGTAWQTCQPAVARDVGNSPLLRHSVTVVAQKITTHLWENINGGWYSKSNIGQIWFDDGYHTRATSVTCGYLAARWWHTEGILQFQTAALAANDPNSWYTNDTNSDPIVEDCAVN